MSKKHRQSVPKVRNFVQMHVQDFNRPQAFEDRKQKIKRGYEKHRGAAIKKAFLGETGEAFLMAVLKSQSLSPASFLMRPSLRFGSIKCALA